MIFLATLIFAGLFYLLTQQFPADPSGISNTAITNLFDQYAPFAGIVFAALSLLLMAVISGIFRLMGLKESRFRKPLLVILGFGPWAAFGYQLVYLEPRFANIAKAIIEYLGEPLLYASSLLVIFGMTWLVVSCFKHDSSPSV